MTPRQHLLMTRFNCRFGAAWTRQALNSEWLRARFDLFDRYCLPSVLAQDCGEFLWIIFADEQTPEPFRSRLDGIAAPNVRPKYVGTLTGELVRDTIRSHVVRGSAQVITTRLDNDDAVSSDFVRRIQQAAAGGERHYLNFPEGFILHRGRVYRHRNEHNAFVSLVEPVAGEIEGVWTVPHTDIETHAPVRQIAGEPAWIQVIHEANVSNKVRGVRCAASDIDDRFVFDRSELQCRDATRGMWWDRQVMAHLWSVRDRAAATWRKAKRIIRPA